MQDDVAFQSLSRHSDYEAALRLVCRVFPADYQPREGETATSVARRTEKAVGTDRALSTVGLLGRRAVSTVFVVPYAMRVGRTTVNVAGIRAVSVDPRRRCHGLCTQIMKHTLDKVEQAGYPLSFLLGIPDFYHRFGYSPAMAWLRVRCDREHLPDRMDGWRCRLFRNTDHAWATRLYNRFTRVRTGSRVRHDRPLRVLRQAHVLESRDGRQQGYLFWEVHEAPVSSRGSAKPFHRKELRVAEHGYRGKGFVNAMLAFLKKQASRNEATRIRIDLHHDHPSLEPLCHGRVVVEEYFEETGGPMVAVLDPLAALRAVRRELEARGSQRGSAFPRHGIVIASDRGRVRISKRTDGLRIDPAYGERADLHAGRHLGRLLVGHGKPERILRQYKLRCRREIRPLIHALFPAQGPYLSPMDTY